MSPLLTIFALWTGSSWKENCRLSKVVILLHLADFCEYSCSLSLISCFYFGKENRAKKLQVTL